MKVTPLGAGSGAPTSVSMTLESGASASRRDAAKAAYLGQTPTQITASDTPVDPMITQAAKNVRSIKINTNATPGRIVEQEAIEQQPENDALSAESTITDTAQATEVKVREPLSPQFAAIAKQRRALQVKEGELAAREKALSEGGSNSISVETLKTNPLKVLRDAGVTYDQLTESILADSGSTPEIQELRHEIKTLKEGFDKNLSDRDQIQEQQVLAEIQRETNQLTSAGKEFELIRAENRQKDVTQLIHRTWKEKGIVLEVREAAKMIEDQLEADTLKLAGLEKIRSKLTSESQGQQAAGQPQMRSLSNRDAARPVLDRKARAMAAALGQHKR